MPTPPSYKSFKWGTREFFKLQCQSIRKIHGLLVDLKILDHEGHIGVEEEQ
jgi:hypothetical protein